MNLDLEHLKLAAEAQFNNTLIYADRTIDAYCRIHEADPAQAAVWRENLADNIDREFGRRLQSRRYNGKERRAPSKGNGLDAQPANDPPAARRLLDWSTLAGTEPPPRQWGINHWLPFAPTLVAGPGGVGKSLLMQTIGTALANATHYVDRIGRPLRTLMWACEDEHDELWRRQVDICAAFGIDVSSLAGRFDLESRVGHDNTLFTTDYGRPIWTPTFKLLREQVNDLRSDVLILDNSRQVYGANEVDPHNVSVFVNGLMPLRVDVPFAPIITGHTARAQGSEYAGTAQWENAVRSRWFFGPRLPDAKLDDDDEPPDSSVRYLCKRKANYSALDYRILNYSNGALVCDPIEVGGGPSVMAGLTAARAERVVLEGFDTLARQHVDMSDGKTSSAFLPRLLVDRKLAQGVPRKELAAALYRLMAAPAVLIRAEVGKYTNRSPRYGLIRP